MTNVWVAMAVGLAAVGCSASDSSPGDSPDVPSEFSLRWGPITADPGVEKVQCVTLRLGNDVPIKVSQIHNVLGDASHHFIVYKSTDTEETLTPQDCISLQNLVDSETGAPLMITQKFEEVLALPDGVAFELEADQMIRLELHYINTGETPKELVVDTTFTVLPESEFEHAADFVFMGSPDISVPPNSASTLGPIHFPIPFELLGTELFGITGHEHQWGTNVYVELYDGQNAQPIYDLPDFNWDEPETVYYDPPLSIPEEGEFRFTCDWFNQSNRTATFGEDVDDEMCFFWAYYYPSRGALTCFSTERIGGSLVQVCCPGNQLCGVIADFFD